MRILEYGSIEEEEQDQILHVPVVADTRCSLPTDVSSHSQLSSLPANLLGHDPDRPLLHNVRGKSANKYALNPLRYSVFLILVIELLERFSYYGLTYTQTPFLTGVYNKEWNSGMNGVQASAFVSASTAIAYTSPFLGALLADGLLGDYYVILLGALLLYIPGCLLIALTTIPGLLGTAFNIKALSVGLLVLYPIGAGAIKSVVNIFGAKQYHPVLQSSLISAYYVKFYMAINLGALMGGILISVAAQKNVVVAYFIPVAMLSLGLIVFAAGTPRYVRCNAVVSEQISKEMMREKASQLFWDMLPVAGVSALIVPFNIAYSQMATTFKVQGIVMNSALWGYVDAASMNNADAISVLFFGYVVGSYLYPALAKRGIRVPTSYKFAVGSFFGVLAMGCALLTEYAIRYTYAQTGKQISILFQTPAYISIGAGEIFAISTAYEVAYTAAPRDKKALASATNLFFVGGVPNFVCIALYQACAKWFHTRDGETSIQSIEQYSSSTVYKYFVVLLMIASIGTVTNCFPLVKRWVVSIENISHEDEPRSYSKWLKRQYTRRESNISDM
mmetsp:Transcript_6775/g.14794  ORF Transcript_6775/g.14794 Transcript_6775/m.14794 type:complete len:561 (-) Transcript_6775:948-2630(-)